MESVEERSLSFEDLIRDLKKHLPFYKRLYRTFRRWWTKCILFPREIKWFIQRGCKGYADCDVWSFDLYLAGIIIGGLTELRNNNYGHPVDLNPEEWDSTLREIIAAFEPYRFGLEDPAKLNRAFDLLNLRFSDLWF